jgi:hypothetical protein
MKVHYLLCNFLIFAVIALGGWTQRSEAAPSDLPLKNSPAAEATTLVPIRDPLTPLEVELGLNHEVSVEQMSKIAARVRREGKPGITGCGVATGPDGKILGGFNATHYSLKITGSEQIYEVVIGNLQTEKNSSLFSVKVNGIHYHLQDRVFVRTKLPEKK